MWVRVAAGAGPQCTPSAGHFASAWFCFGRAACLPPPIFLRRRPAGLPRREKDRVVLIS